MITLTEDPTVKPADKQKLKGFVLKWRKSKILFGCALFHDLLKPSSILCKVLQDESLTVVDAIEGVLKTNKFIKKLDFNELPTVKQVFSQLEHTEEGVTYQGTLLIQHDQGIDYPSSIKL